MHSTTPAVLPATLSRIQHFAALTGATDIAIIFLLSPPVPPTNSTRNGASNSHQPHSAASSASGLHAYHQLSASLLMHADIPSIPLLPLSDLSSLESLLRTYVSALCTPQPAAAPQKLPNAAMELLPFCTTSPPMRQETVIRLTDLFSSLRDLAVVGEVGEGVDESGDGRDGRSVERAEELVRGLVELLGEEEAKAAVEFWKEEWVAE
ncbi:hypothetical protein H2199_001241 [Coniosporium tulheliwenetii]|uniref:Uncharacterized protein n=1 Tax=Coniosporium tulheliwenetii TaxID=3383036 RepID=A0ACC2ZLH4_9PEZI|nr:hypothetical protein H2199_001241 [Cladosporium sp. JES 115]